MSLKYSVRSIHMINFREFEDVKINLKEGQNFILMRNGYGKTSMLDAIHSIYTGELLTNGIRNGWENISAAKYNNKFTKSDKNFSSVKLEIEINNKNGEAAIWKVWQKWDHKKGENTFQTEVPGEGLEDGWLLPRDFSKKFGGKIAFADLFVFDAEKARENIENQKGEQVEEAFIEITNTSRIYDLVHHERGDMEQLYSDELEKRSLTHLDTASKNYSSWLIKVKKQIKETQEWKTTLTIKINSNRKELKKWEKAYDALGKADEKASKEERRLNKKDRGEKAKQKEKTRELLEYLGNPSNLPNKQWKDAHEIHRLMFVLKIPEGVGRVFFKDLCNSDTCVCGEEMSSKMKKHIEERADEYLEDDTLILVKKMQGIVQENKDGDKGIDIFELKEEIKIIRRNIRKIRDDLIEIRKKFNPKIQEDRKKLTVKIQKMKEEIKKQVEKLEIIESTDVNRIRALKWDKGCLKDSDTLFALNSWENKVDNLMTLERIKKTLEKKVNTTEDLLNLKNGQDLAQIILTMAGDEVRNDYIKIAEEILDESFRKFPVGEGYGLRLNKEKGVIFLDRNEDEQDEASVGMTVAAAYSLVSAMSEVGGISVPLIIDSPTTGCDTVSTAGICDFMWGECHQEIFIIESGERDKIKSSSKILDKKGDSEKILIRREEEPMDGLNPSGPMIVQYNDEDFFNYYSSAWVKGS